jgi:hypothetical protein
MNQYKIPKILSGVIMIVMMASRVSAFVLPRIRPAVVSSQFVAHATTTTTRLFSATEEATTPTVLKRVKTLHAVDPTEEAVIVKGWVKTIRKQKTVAFVQVNDGSNLKGIQCVVTLDNVDEATKKGKKINSAALIIKKGWVGICVSFQITHSFTPNHSLTSIFRIGQSHHWLCRLRRRTLGIVSFQNGRTKH